MNNFSRKTINTYIYLKISPVMVNKSTDIQVYNESKQQGKNILVYHSKKLLWLLYIFWLTRMKEFEWTRMMIKNLPNRLKR